MSNHSDPPKAKPFTFVGMIGVVLLCALIWNSIGCGRSYGNLSAGPNEHWAQGVRDQVRGRGNLENKADDDPQSKAAYLTLIAAAKACDGPSSELSKIELATRLHEAEAAYYSAVTQAMRRAGGQ